MRHALSVDVEDWYHDGAPPTGCEPECRVEQNTLRLLELFQEHGARATFFFLGEVAEKFPGLVRDVVDAGHEIGSHGYHHRPLRDLLRYEFRADVARSLRVIEDAAGCPVRGFRAPYFSIPAGVKWPVDILSELGLRYDSSILPIDRPPGLELVCPRTAFRLSNGLWEIPVGVLQVGYFWSLPLASGNGLRLVPPVLLRRWIRRFERDVGPAVFYLHPWEIDVSSPTADAPHRWLLRVGRGSFQARLRTLLTEHTFASVSEIFATQLER